MLCLVGMSLLLLMRVWQVHIVGSPELKSQRRPSPWNAPTGEYRPLSQPILYLASGQRHSAMDGMISQVHTCTTVQLSMQRENGEPRVVRGWHTNTKDAREALRVRSSFLPKAFGIPFSNNTVLRGHAMTTAAMTARLYSSPPTNKQRVYRSSPGFSEALYRPECQLERGDRYRKI